MEQSLGTTANFVRYMSTLVKIRKNPDCRPNIPVFQYSSIPTTCYKISATQLWDVIPVLLSLGSLRFLFMDPDTAFFSSNGFQSYDILVHIPPVRGLYQFHRLAPFGIHDSFHKKDGGTR